MEIYSEKILERYENYEIINYILTGNFDNDINLDTTIFKDLVSNLDNFLNTIRNQHNIYAKTLDELIQEKCKQCHLYNKENNKCEININPYDLFCRWFINLVNELKCPKCESKTFEMKYEKYRTMYHMSTMPLFYFKCDQCDYKSGLCSSKDELSKELGLIFL